MTCAASSPCPPVVAISPTSRTPSPSTDVVLLVEKIAATGGQVLEAAKIITEAGARVDRIVCVIDRKQGARDNIEGAGYVFESILTKEDLGIKD